VSSVAVLGGLPLDVHGRVRCFGFKRRIHGRQHGERQPLKEDDGQNAEPAKIPRLSRRDPLHSYAARVFRVPPQGTPDQCIKLRSGRKRVKVATLPTEQLAAEGGTGSILRVYGGF